MISFKRKIIIIIMRSSQPPEDTSPEDTSPEDTSPEDTSPEVIETVH
jgi:hypothetical protein